MKIPFDEYLKIDALSSSFIKLLLKSPAHAKYGMSGISFDSDKKGTALHSLVLEGRNEIIAPLNVSRRSKADRQAWAEWYALRGGSVDITKPAATWDEQFHEQTGLYIGIEEEVKAIRDQADSVFKVCPEISSAGDAEFTETFYDLGYKFKARYDKVDQENHIIYDLKSCKDASPYGFAAACRQYQYHIQAQLYSCAYFHNHGAWPVFKFVAVEKTKPYHAAVYTLDDYSMERASENINSAIEIYESCLESGEWPGYQSQELSLFGGSQVSTVDDLDELMA